MTLSRTRRLIGLLGRVPAAGTECSLAGWGVRRHGGLSPTLQELEVTVLDTQMCNNSRFWNGDIAPTMICFQGRHRGSAPSKVRSWWGPKVFARGPTGCKALSSPLRCRSPVWGTPRRMLTPSREARCFPPSWGGGGSLAPGRGPLPTVTSTQGDSGGPLVCGKRAAVAGVLSFTSPDITNPFKPPVATSAVKHKNWIRKTLRRGCGSPQPGRTGQTDHPVLFTQVGF